MWLVLALAAALFQVLRNTAMKQLGHALDEYINVWGRFTFLLPFALAACVVGGFPTLAPGFWWWCLAFGAGWAAAVGARTALVGAHAPATAPATYHLAALADLPALLTSDER